MDNISSTKNFFLSLRCKVKKVLKRDHKRNKRNFDFAAKKVPEGAEPKFKLVLQFPAKRSLFPSPDHVAAPYAGIII